MSLSNLLDLIAYADWLRGLMWLGFGAGILLFGIGAAHLLYLWLERDRRPEESIGLTQALTGDQHQAKILKFPHHSITRDSE